MILRPHRRNLVVWSASVAPAESYGAPRFMRPARTRRIRRCMRTGVLLIVIGLMRLVCAVRTHWQAYKQLCELERELAAYSTPAERCDLEATFDRYPNDVTCELRDILARQAMAALNTSHAWTGSSPSC